MSKRTHENLLDLTDFLSVLLDNDEYLSIKYGQGLSDEEIKSALAQALIEKYKKQPETIPTALHHIFNDFIEKIKNLLSDKRISRSYNGNAVKALALIRGRGETIPHTQILNVNGVNIFTPEGILKIGAGAVKIYRYTVSEFTKRNHSNASDEKLKLSYLLDLKDFAEANGVDTENADNMKNFRRKVKESLHKLQTATISWTEKIKGEPKSFNEMAYIGGYSLKGNALEIDFTPRMAQYLVQLPQILYPRSLYALDDRDFNAYAIGEAMCIHYSQDNNVILGTEGKLRVETLLMSTSYPSCKELKANRWSWVEKVKEPFESSLDKLTECGFLKDWVYCHEGGIELTDSEAYVITERGYSYFTSLIVKYELNDFQPHIDRLTAIQERKSAQIEKANRKRKRKKNDSEKTDNSEE